MSRGLFLKTKLSLISTLFLGGILSACATASNTQTIAPQIVAESTEPAVMSETKTAENTANGSADICKTVFKREPIGHSKSCMTAGEWRQFDREKREDQFGNGVQLPEYQPDM